MHKKSLQGLEITPGAGPSAIRCLAGTKGPLTVALTQCTGSLSREHPPGAFNFERLSVLGRRGSSLKSNQSVDEVMRGEVGSLPRYSRETGKLQDFSQPCHLCSSKVAVLLWPLKNTAEGAETVQGKHRSCPHSFSSHGKAAGPTLGRRGPQVHIEVLPAREWGGPTHSVATKTAPVGQARFKKVVPVGLNLGLNLFSTHVSGVISPNIISVEPSA